MSGSGAEERLVSNVSAGAAGVAVVDDDKGTDNVDDDEVVHAQEGDQPSRAGHDDAARRLLRDNCSGPSTSGPNQNKH